ncbi:MAG: molybdopterin-dependent oxidoreductase [Proteobacteria bacterium]|nr:molybdopterin-dependent oxidoreductase [Pseudomonadota bacterium]
MWQARAMSDKPATQGSATIRSTCRLCYNGCGVLVHVRDARPVHVTGDPDHPLSRGRLCPRGRAALEMLDHPQRLRRPLKRSGPRGGGQWEPISWDEALDATIQGLTQVSDRLGPQAVAFMRGGSKGTSDDHLTRLANIFGSPNVSTTSSICYAPCALASKHTYGFWAYPDMEHPPRCMVLWGMNPRATHPALHQEVVRAMSAGAKLLVIDPCAKAERAELQLRPRPGSDGALALGMARVIITEGLQDQEFIERWTVGFKRLCAHLEPYTPERVEAMTWVAAEDIRKAARLYATIRPGCILWGNALESGPNNYQTCRAICILRALTGNLGAPGSDILWSDEGELLRRSPLFTRPDLLPQGMTAQRLGAGAGMLPDFPYVPHQLVAKAILDDEPYPVRGVYLQGGNLLCTSADSQLMARALEKLEFFATTDHFMTPTTALADIVFPASMYLEHDSVEQPWHWPAATVQQRAADPGQTRSEGQICNDLARRMGSGEQAFADTRQFLDFYLQPSGLSFDEFRAKGVIYGPGQPRAHETHGFPTPSGLVELYSSTLEGWGVAPLPTYLEPAPLGTAFPLVLASRKSATFYHSCGRQLASLRKANPEPTLSLHPDTARPLGLGDGDMARLATARGTIVQRVRLDSRLDPRVVMAEHGWWFPEQGADNGFGWQQANLNLLTDADGPCGRELGSPTLRGMACRVEGLAGEQS